MMPGGRGDRLWDAKFRENAHVRTIITLLQ